MQTERLQRKFKLCISFLKSESPPDPYNLRSNAQVLLSKIKRSCKHVFASLQHLWMCLYLALEKSLLVCREVT